MKTGQKVATYVCHIKINPLIPQLVEKFPTFRGTLGFVIVFTKASHLVVLRPS